MYLAFGSSVFALQHSSFSLIFIIRSNNSLLVIFIIISAIAVAPSSVASTNEYKCSPLVNDWHYIPTLMTHGSSCMAWNFSRWTDDIGIKHWICTLTIILITNFGKLLVPIHDPMLKTTNYFIGTMTPTCSLFVPNMVVLSVQILNNWFKLWQIQLIKILTNILRNYISCKHINCNWR